MKTVYCPIKSDQINGGDCYWLCSIAEREVKPPEHLPDDIGEWNEEKREKCLNCKYHFGTGEDEED